MATYFPSSNNQTDAGTFLSFRQSLPGSYSEAPIAPGSMMMFMNYSSSSASYSDTFVNTSQEQNGCVDIPPVRDSDSNTSQQEILSNPGGSRIGIHDFTTWKGSRNEMLMMHPIGDADSVMQVAQNMQGQGLSLSLGSHLPSEIEISHVQCQNPNQGFTSFLTPTSAIPGEGSGGNAYFGDDDDNSHTKQQRNAYYLPPGYPGSNSNIMKADISPYGMLSYSSTARAFPNAKYLKAAQQLLDEVVNIGKAVKEHNFKKELIKHSKGYDVDLKSKSSDPPVTGSCSNPQDSSNHQSELSATEKLEVQNKMTKLLSMLEEIDQRYRQYYHQMQIVISSFDVIAGDGAAKPYTALALQTISRHFRCLRDAISVQIRALRKSLGEQDASDNSNGIGISRLRYVDQQLRQQRALQQLGMMQQHTWRPQRGLPESSVSILRAWLFEHFLHPYPKDSDKIMLARQTGLTRSQVSNWFINARVRLWKPMVEKIYKEENCDIEMDSNTSSEVASRIAIEDAKVEEREEFQQNATSAEHERYNSGQKLESRANCFNDVEMEGAINEGNQSEPAMDGCSLVPDTFVQDRFMSLPSRFGSGVSLTLGLQRGEGGSLPMSIETHVSYAPTRGDAIYDTSPTTMDPETEEFNCLDSGNRQNRFCSSQLLHDFVA